jgi:hypothetical protein
MKHTVVCRKCTVNTNWRIDFNFAAAMISLSFVRNMSLSEETTPARVRRIKKQETRKTKLNDGDEATGGEEGVQVWAGVGVMWR